MGKTINKVLSLALAVCLIFGLTSLPALAATNEIGGLKPGDYGYTETQLLIRLGVLVGIDDSGTVASDMTLNRYTATTFAYRISTGQTGADIYARDTAFPDVTSNIWASGYVNWAASQDPPVINGRLDGTFDGDAPVLLAEYCAILTRALGLSDDNTPYPDGVITIAQKNGLLENITNKKAYDELTRTEAIIMTYNALFAIYDTKLIRGTDDKVVAQDMTLLSEVFGAEARVAYVSGASTALANSKIAKQDQVELTYLIADKAGMLVPGESQILDFPYDADDLLFRKVKAWVVPGDTNKDDVLLALKPADNTVITAKAGTFAADGDNWKVTANGTTHKGVKQFGGSGSSDNYKAGTVNYAPTIAEQIPAVLGVHSDTMLTLIKWGGSGYFDAIIVVQPQTEQVTEVTSTYIRTNGGLYQFENADDNVTAVAYEGIDVDDWVYVYPCSQVVGNVAGTVNYIEKAEVLSEVVYTAKSSDSNTKYTLGGTQYTAQQLPPAQGIDGLKLGDKYGVVLNSVGDIFKIIYPDDRLLVIFDANGGSPEPKGQRVAKDDLVTMPTTPTFSGYTFEGWYKDANHLWDFATDTVEENMTLTAYWDWNENEQNNNQGGGQDEPLKITTTTLQGGKRYDSYRAQITASGGTGPYNFEVTVGDLPMGLSLAANGNITGVPMTAEGSYTFTVKVTDAAGATLTKIFTIIIR